MIKEVKLSQIPFTSLSSQILRFDQLKSMQAAVFYTMSAQVSDNKSECTTVDTGNLLMVDDDITIVTSDTPNANREDKPFHQFSLDEVAINCCNNTLMYRV